jgi:hypothetical protein
MIRLYRLLLGLVIFYSSTLGWIVMTKTATDERQPSVAWLNNQYLVAWTDGRDWSTDSAITIHGCRILADGNILDTNSFVIQGGYPDHLTPTVCADSSAWMIAFQQGC